MIARPPIDSLIAKNEEFTLVEFNLMRVWLEGVLRGLGLIGFNVDHARMLRVAGALLLTGLRLEHWISLLDSLPENQTEEELAYKTDRQIDFRAALNEFDELVKEGGFSEDGRERMEVLRRELQ